jgi:hypothetical protein
MDEKLREDVPRWHSYGEVVWSWRPEAGVKFMRS